MKYVHDSNAIIDLLNGHPEALKWFGTLDEVFVSRMTWMEVMCGIKGEDDERKAREFWNGCQILPITAEIAERAVFLRKTLRLKIPDAVIWATALQHGAMLVTRNTKDFRAGDATVVVPYAV